jgi:hypothetical protein
MYGAYIRAAAYGAMSPPLAALLGAFLAPFLGVMRAGEHADAESAQRLIGLFEITMQEFLLIELLSIAVFIIARAVVEKHVGGGY